ncbi:MAG: hypothetical protein O3C40_09590 [Planctomycetota bacterium]|nr:hypothetical protein [Planctomycetota bacterium]
MNFDTASRLVSRRLFQTSARFFCRQSLPLLLLFAEFRIRSGFAKTRVDANQFERLNDCGVLEVQQVKTEGLKLFQRAARVNPHEKATHEWRAAIMAVAKRQHRALNLLSLVAGMFGVPSPSTLDERDGRADSVIRSASLENIIEVVRIAVVIDPFDLLATSRRASPFPVEIEAMPFSKFLQ